MHDVFEARFLGVVVAQSCGVADYGKFSNFLLRRWFSVYACASAQLFRDALGDVKTRTSRSCLHPGADFSFAAQVAVCIQGLKRSMSAAQVAG